jgi:tRNA (guanine37-N1)-methyltransferase
VPEELLSGNHEKIEEYRFIASVKRTLERRLDLIQNEQFSASEILLLRKYDLLKLVKEIQCKIQGNWE